MSTPLFRYTIDAHAKPAAHPVAGAHAGLAGFLTGEANSTDYVDLLLDCVKDAARTGKDQVNTGNAYAVTVGHVQVTIEHLHVKTHAKITEPLAVFTGALHEWRAFLAKN